MHFRAMADSGQNAPRDTADINREDEKHNQESTIPTEEVPASQIDLMKETEKETSLYFYKIHKTKEMENALQRAEYDVRGNSPRLDALISSVEDSIPPTCPAASDVENLARALHLQGKYIQALILLRVAKEIHDTSPFPTPGESAIFFQRLISLVRDAAVQQSRSDASTRDVVVKHGLEYMKELCKDLTNLLDADDESGRLVLLSKRFRDICFVSIELGQYEEVISLCERGIVVVTQIRRVMDISVQVANLLTVRARALHSVNRVFEAICHLRFAQTLLEANSKPSAEGWNALNEARVRLETIQKLAESLRSTDSGKVLKTYLRSRYEKKQALLNSAVFSADNSAENLAECEPRLT